MKDHTLPIPGSDISSSGVHGNTDKELLIQSGDVELNPGPAPSPMKPPPNDVNGECNGVDKARPQFKKFGQYEPPTVRIRNIINQYVGDTKGIGLQEVVKELVQNADDAKATKVQFILDKRTLPSEHVWDEWKLLQGPALCVYNNAIFTDNDIESIQKLGVGSKSTDPDKTGQFGIGFNVVYQMTDVPTLLSNGVDLCMFDPHLSYVPGATNGCPGGHVNLKDQPEFKSQWADVLRGFLPEIVNQRGSTVFRFPLRTKEMKSKISARTYDEESLAQMQLDLEDMGFRLLMHNCLLFTKNVDYVGAAIIEEDGTKRIVTEVKRRISMQDTREIKTCYQRLSNETKALLSGQIGIEDITRGSITYNMVTEDEFNKTNWVVNQTFGFHGEFSDDEYEFLSEFVGGSFSGKKFSPIGGIASKKDEDDELKGVTFCFLELPIENGLPVHLNGHFAIHSSRRSIWSNTAFGDWNRILQRHVLVPAYCSFLKSITKECNIKAVQNWYLSYFPHWAKASEQYYQDLIADMYFCILNNNLPVIPIVRPYSLSENSGEKLEFLGPKDVYFVSEKNRNLEVEKILMVLGVNVCTFPEITEKFLAAKSQDIDFMTPRVASSCLKDASSRMDLPRSVVSTPLKTIETIKTLVEYCLQDELYRDYHRLEGLPLCLTQNGKLREFRRKTPVFLSLEFKDIFPYNQDVFLHEELTHYFNPAQTYNNTPIRKLMVQDLSSYVDEKAAYIRDHRWQKLVWKFLKQHITKYNARNILFQIKDLPILKATDGKYYKISEGKSIVNIFNANPELQQIVKKMKMPLVDLSAMADGEDLTEEELSDMITPCVLDASQPDDILHMLTVFQNCIYNFTDEECEHLLFFFKSGLNSIRRSQLFLKTLKLLPIFETVDGDYRALTSSSNPSILDDSIPTKGVTGWMKNTDSILLKEKKAYAELYQVLCLHKKNTVDVYIDHIFPNFAGMDAELQMMHLIGIRDSVLPMVNSFGTEIAKRKFNSELKKLPFIPYQGQLHHANEFYDTDMLILRLVENMKPLPEEFTGIEWRELLQTAGLKVELSPGELLKCASTVCTIQDPVEAQSAAQVVLDTALYGDFDEAVLQQIADLPFVPAGAWHYTIDEELLEACPSKQTDKFLCLRGSLQYEGRQKNQVLQHTLLAWTVLPILPKWAKVPDELIDMLGVKQSPTVAEVCQHCSVICQAVTDQLSDAALKCFENVMWQIYDFLQGSCNCHNRDCEICTKIHELKEVKCIVLNDGTIRVQPWQLVLNFPSDIDSDTLHPYIYARPFDLAKFDDFFKRLGAMESPSPDLYAGILTKLHEECGTSNLKTNQKQTASTAVYGLFMSLQLDIESELNVKRLYLPSDKAVMVASNELIVNDSKMVARKYKKRKYKYLCKLASCGLFRNFREYINLLPVSIRPRILTDLVQQLVLVKNHCRKGPACHYMGEYKMRIQSESFGQVLLMLGSATDPEITDIEAVVNPLRTIDFVCFNEMNIYLGERGIPTEIINTPKLVHHDVSDDGTQHRLYIKHYDVYPGDADMVSAIADAIKEMICKSELFTIDSGKIAKLLRCEGKDAIDDFLLEEGVATMDDDMMSRPKLGTVIPESEHWMYGCDPDVRFQPKEYVGYMHPDTNEMINARIVRECKTKKSKSAEEVSNMFREYVIDLGLEHPITAQSLDLYREVKRKNAEQQKQQQLQKELSEAEEKYNRLREDMAIEEQKRQVTKLLEEVFSDPMRVDERDKLRKRLYLKWHPDKQGGARAAKEVFQHLLKEIDRLTEEYKNFNMFNGPNPFMQQSRFQRRHQPEPPKPPPQPESTQETTSRDATPEDQPHSEQSDKATSKSQEGDDEDMSDQSESGATSAEQRSYKQEKQHEDTSDDEDDLPVDGDSSKSPKSDGEEWFDSPSSPLEKRKTEFTTDGIPEEEKLKAETPPDERNGDVKEGEKIKEEEESEDEPNMEPSREWFRQAKKDLQCASILKDHRGYEWTCTICYEVVRKVLVATILNKTEMENQHDLQMTRYLPKLLEKIQDLPNFPQQLASDVSKLRKLNANYLFSFDLSVLDTSKTTKETYTEDMAKKIMDMVGRIIEYMGKFNEFD